MRYSGEDIKSGLIQNNGYFRSYKAIPEFLINHDVIDSNIISFIVQIPHRPMAYTRYEKERHILFYDSNYRSNHFRSKSYTSGFLLFFRLLCKAKFWLNFNL